jgi:hypothetical protein
MISRIKNILPWSPETPRTVNHKSEGTRRNMKRVIALLLVVGFSASALGQGQLIFNHWATNPGDGSNAILGVDGSPLFGTGYSGQMYAGPVGGALNPVTEISGSTALAVFPMYGSARAGYLNTSANTVVIPGVEPGSAADIQLRVWENAGGSLTDWSAADGTASEWGISDVVPTTPNTLGGITPGGPQAPVNMPSVPSFQLQMVPEPTTWALLGIGALAMFFRRRK